MKPWSFALFLVPALAARADTVFLKNGEWIDGKVSMKTETFVELQIGDIGKIELQLSDIHSIEQNNRLGGKSVDGSYVEPKGKTEVLGGKGQTTARSTPSAEASKKPGEKPVEDKPEAAKPFLGEGRDKGAEKGASKEEEPPQKEIDPELKKRIQTLVEELQRQKVRNRVQAERHLEAIGQPSIPFLIPVARSSSDLTRIAVMRLFHSFGDQRVVPAAIEGLLDDNEYVRDLANKCLKRITGEDFGYQSTASPRRREAAHHKWADWWDSEKKTLADERKRSGDSR